MKLNTLDIETVKLRDYSLLKIDETKLAQKERKILAEKKFALCRVDVNTDYGKSVAAAFGALARRPGRATAGAGALEYATPIQGRHRRHGPG